MRQTSSRLGCRRLLAPLAVWVACLQFVPSALSGEFSAFQKAYVRDADAPDTITDTFNVLNPATTWTLRAINGSLQDTSVEKVSSSTVQFNGIETLQPSHFNQTVNLIEVPVTLLDSNTVATQLRSNPGGRLTIEIIGLDDTPPSIAISHPLNGSATSDNTPPFAATFHDGTAGINASSFRAHLNGVEVTSSCQVSAPGLGGTGTASCATPSPLLDGLQTLISSIADRAANAAQAVSTFLVDTTAPTTTATPTPGPNVAGWNNSNVIVNLTADDGAGSGVAVIHTALDAGPGVEISGASADVTITTEGAHLLNYFAVDQVGNAEASKTLTVNLDKTAPAVIMTSPAEDLTTPEELITISGMVTDANPITALTLNGQPIALSNGSFSHDLPLVEGLNTVEVIATDIAGNVGSASRSVTRLSDTTPPAPPVVFSVTSPTRLIFQMLSGEAEPGSRLDILGGLEPVSMQVFENGMFMVNVNLKLDAINQLSLTATDRAGNQSQSTEVTIIQSRELPLPGSGEPAKINVASGDAQTGLIGQPLVHPVTAIVTDLGGQPVAGVEVRFEVPMGSGLVNGSSAAVVRTGADGKVHAAWTLGQEPGTQMVMANFAGNQHGPVEFMATALELAPIEETRISGVILDNDLRAIPGVRVTLVGTALSALTDAEGRFVILNPPLGNGQLLDIDASGATLPGKFSDLAFEINVLPGQDNKLPRPMFLPLLNEGIEVPMRFLDATTGEVLEERRFVMPTEPNLPPVTLRIPVGTQIMFPPGVERKLSVTRVPLDRVPMALEDGRFSQLYVSIQPEGAHFDPPLPICFPNLDGAAPGEAVTLMSFVHTEGRFMAIGPATVSPDGATVCTDPGVGIREADWHATPRSPTALVTTICGTQALPAGLTEDDLECDCWCESVPAASMGGGVFCAGNVPVSSATLSDFRFDEGSQAALQELQQRGGTASLECVCQVKVTLSVEPTSAILHQGGTAILTATAEPIGGTFSWTSADPTIATVTGTTETATLSGLAPGATQVEVTYTLGTQQTTAMVPVTIFTVAIAHPSGEPATSPGPTNEFTYTSATPGVLTLPMQASLNPDTPEVRTLLEANRLRWRIDPISDSHGAQANVRLAWSAAFPGEASAGEGLTTTATFTGLPPSNNDFGRKTVRLQCLDEQGNVVVERTTAIEVFFPKTDTNHPGGQAGSPNWFHYWLQAIGGRPNTVYGGFAGTLFGEAPGMLRWSYLAPRDKTQLIIYDQAAEVDPGDPCAAGGKKPTTGIDSFEDTVLHENHHTIQIANADAVVGTLANTPWRFGWSWNQGANHNHWAVGPDGQPGIAGVDDDGDGNIDNSILTGRGELGRGDDELLHDPADPGQSWPTAFGALPPQNVPAGCIGWAGNSAIEDAAYDAEPDTENNRLNVDWGDVGKQHRTEKKYDD